MTKLEQVRAGYKPVFEKARTVLISANVQYPYIEWYEEFAERVYADVAKRIEESEKKYGQGAVSFDETR